MARAVLVSAHLCVVEQVGFGEALHQSLLTFMPRGVRWPSSLSLRLLLTRREPAAYRSRTSSDQRRPCSVGTVMDLSNGARVATVQVDDVWRGNAIPAAGDVVGSPALNAAATSVDRTYAAGSQIPVCHGRRRPAALLGQQLHRHSALPRHPRGPAPGGRAQRSRPVAMRARNTTKNGVTGKD
jgi:hypothetical protein